MTRSNSILLVALTLFCICGALYATSLSIMEPVNSLIGEDGSVIVGRAGPGQTVYLVADRYSDDTGNTPVWDSIVGVEFPVGWEIEDSPLYESPMKLKIKISPNAANGEYNLTLAAVDEGNYDGKGNMTFHAIVIVDQEVFSVEVSPERVQSGVGQPATYYVTIRNTGVASDPFEIKAKGLPAWDYKKVILVNYESEKTVPYEVVVNEQIEAKMFTIEVTSLSSPQIKEEKRVVLDTRNTLTRDWKATTHGALIFPLLEQPIYSILGLLGQLLG